MTSLHRKLFRDLWSIKGQALAIGLVIACGVATFVMSLCTYASLELIRSTYYERYRFADVFAGLQRAPESLGERIERIPGVARIQTRVVKEVTLDVPGLVEPARGRLISLPLAHRSALNDLFLRSGRRPEPGRADEVLASEAFTVANELAPGDRIKAVINGTLRELEIVGVVLSPEYLIQISPGEILPDDKRFGVLWMDHKALATVFDMHGAFNDVSLTLLRGASEKDALQQLDLLLEPYGGFRSYSREDQISYRFLDDELTQLRGTALVAPTIFLGVAAFLLNVVLSRIVSAQREQIAMLKAFGYTRGQIAIHYLSAVLLISLSGTLLGVLGGTVLGRGITEMYAEFYRFPLMFFRLDPVVVSGSFLLSTAIAVLGTVRTVSKAARLPPAEAMRPEPPANFRPTAMERLGLQAFLSPVARMILRQLERRFFKSLLSVLGISLAVAVLVLGRFSIDAVDFLLEHQFELSQRQDLTVSLFERSEQRALFELGQLPGVIRAEPFRTVPVRLRHGPLKKELSLLGLSPDAELFRVVDAQRNRVPLPPSGVVLSEQLAKSLKLSPGGEVEIEVLDGKRQSGTLSVTGLVSDFAGSNAYLSLEALHEFLQEGPSISGAHLQVDESRMPRLYATLKQTPRVAGVNVLEAARRSFEETIAENLMKMTAFNILFSCVIAFGVVYNTARISLAERSRELATLRVIGFTRREISTILLGELAILTLAAIPLGLGIGYGFAWFLVISIQTDLYRIPLVVSPFTFGYASTVVLLASLVSGLMVRGSIDRLDLISVLKSRD
jgi:putative ABC transport system permease protein